MSKIINRVLGFGLAFCLLMLMAVWLLWQWLQAPELSIPETFDGIISKVNIVNPGQGVKTDHSIVIKHGQIVEVRPHQPSDPVPLCEGCYVIPGLIDAHVHTPPAVVAGNQALFALLYLAHGVTSVRDVGQSEPGIADLAKQLNNGDLPGPHMYRCGPVLDGSPAGWPVASTINTAAQATLKVEQLSAEGVDCIKVYNELDASAFHAIALAAKAAGLPLIGHVPHKVKLHEVRDFEAQHMTGVPYVSRARPPLGWDIRNQDILAMTEQDINHSLAIAKTNNISFTPTLANFRLRLSASDPEQFTPPAAAKFLPGFWPQAWDFVAGHPESHAEISLQLKGIPALHHLVRQSHALGIDILAGTDTLMPWVIPGAGLIEELTELSAALGSVEQAFIAATHTNAKHIDKGNIGSIAAGYRADLLLSVNNPLLQPWSEQRWHSVIVAGRIYSDSWIQSALGQYQQHFNSDVYAWVMGNLIGFIAKAYGSNAG